MTTNIDGTPCTDLAGYRVYFGETSPISKTNSQFVDALNSTTFDVGNLIPGHTYYFRVSAYDTNSNESDLSTDEGTKSIP